ncbi:Uncharacterized protein YhaN [Bhargavaea ginsengi]|uniref:Uncharacterized protein YhaN n=1 Tax=Bhargavaea ginsengi TaxID=426757 RepID=A0A1H7BWV9_9BACL|nr:AAA family ATPase [Bhargavaea ginsengi]SEJ80817.1 Uncharacterized protein YhaN [Bhargavaea ginsengi]
MMSITKLVIYGFGKHENVTIDLKGGINVLYGPNEAGKTTIRQFILHTLFGFPQRGSSLLRYEPKAGGAYGGQVHVADSEFGSCVIERIAGRSAGKVTVRYPDGSREEGEEALTRLLRGYDRQSFESIFSFSLLQLQEIGKMNEEELGQALIASGTTGAEDLAGFRARLDKEMDGLFKKSGRVPEMNVLLNELRQTEAEIGEYRKKSDAYAPMKKRAAEIDVLLKKAEEEEAALSSDQEQLAVLRQAAPLEVERLQSQEELRAIGDAPFPADGIRRYEALKDRKIATDAAISNLQERIAAIRRELPEEPDTERLSRIRSILAEEAVWHDSRSMESNAEQSLRELAGIKDRLLARLGLDDEETAVRADASIRKEEELHTLSEAYDRALRNLERQDERIAEKASEASQVADERTALEASGPDDSEIEWASKWPSLRKRLAAAEAKQSAESSNNRQPILILAGLAALIIAMAIYSENLLLAAAGVAAGAAAAFLLLKQGGADTLTEDERQLLSRYGGREEELDRRAERVGRHFTELDRLIEADERLRGMMTELRISRKTAAENLDDAEKRLGTFLEAYGIKGKLPAAIVPELFRLVRELQETVRRIRSEQEKRDGASLTAGSIRSRAHEVIGHPVADPLLFSSLKESERDLLQTAEKRNRLLAEEEKLKEERAEAESLTAAFGEEIGSLFAAAAATGEPDFYEAAQRSARKTVLQEALGRIEGQLRQIGVSPSADIPPIEALVRRMDVNRDALQAIAEERSGLIKEQAELEARMGHLVADSAYDALLQEFEQKKAAFRELAVAWAARKAAVSAIDGATGRLKEQKLPDVITRASEWFGELTGGAYAALVLSEDGQVGSEAANGMRFGLHELSQATKEQAYISMRLSLAASLLESAPFPIIMDDPFVHFDQARLGNMINLLEELKINHQFLYFTCHREMAGAFKEAAVIEVAGTGSERGVLR